jgi:hypothetical protein
MPRLTVNGKPVSPEEESLICRLLMSDPEYLRHNEDDDITLKEVVALMDIDHIDITHSFYGDIHVLTHLDAEKITTLTESEYFKLAPIFENHFNGGFVIHTDRFLPASKYSKASSVPNFLQSILPKESRELEVLNLVAGNGKFERIKVSDRVAKELESAFTRKRENGFLLFADSKTGVIEVAIRLEDGGKLSIPWPTDVIMFYKYVMQKEGYIFVGKYHSHTMSKAEIDAEYNNGGYRYIMPRTSALLSRADGHECDGPQRMDKFQLLGSVQEETFQLRAFLGFTADVSERLNADERVVNDRFVKHYRGINSHYELDIQTAPSSVDPTARAILKKYPAFEEDVTVPISYEDYIKLKNILSPEQADIVDKFEGLDMRNAPLALNVSRKWNGAGAISIVINDPTSKFDQYPVLSLLAEWDNESMTANPVLMLFWGFARDSYPITLSKESMEKTKQLLKIYGISEKYIFEM